MGPERVTHLLAADEQFQFGVYLAVCGQRVPRSDLPPSECPQDCECDLALYCPECVSQAAESSAQARPGPGAQHDEGGGGYYLGECGHRVPAESGADGPLFHVGPCRRCDEAPQISGS
ncbi:MAG: hypothetical protein ACRDRI_19775 [Pseudonocardiaceae bacterium]